MSYDSNRHHRRSIRLAGYDYTQPGAYFVTICTHQREWLLGEVVDGKVVLSEFGRIAHDEWWASSRIRREIELDAFVVMPNHIHGIVWIVADDPVEAEAHGRVGAHGRAPLRRPPKSLGSFIAGYKSVVTKRINQMRGTPGVPVWQRNYWEHIIRTERALQAIRQYIADNPARWSLDRYNPAAVSRDPRAAELWRLLREDATTMEVTERVGTHGHMVVGAHGRALPRRREEA